MHANPARSSLARSLLSVGIAWIIAAGPSCRVDAIELSKDGTTVEVNELGLLTSSPLEPIHTIDADRLVLTGNIAEWFGVTFSQGGVMTRASGAGSVSDWDPTRLPVTPVSFETTLESALSVCSIDGLEIATELRFDAGDLIATVTLTNGSATPIVDVLYSREWQTTPTDPLYWSFPTDLPGGPIASGVARRLWMTDDLQPGDSKSLTFSYRRESAVVLLGPGTVDVPLSLWTAPGFPGGLNFGATNGVSWGDFDADGWPDVFACMSGALWRNVGGADWQLAADLDSELPFTARRYGSSFGDYDNDGLPDIGTEPRNGWGGDECFHLLHNLGSTAFDDVATDPTIVDLQPCNSDAETICWGDVDGDSDLDCFLPVYPPWAFGGPGNFFLENNGPAGPGGAYTFTESSGPSGVDNPPGSARSEGAQFVDVDNDGDMDLYCNGTLYQNQSTLGDPSFANMTESGSGILLSTQLEEGCLFADYDLDGDFDFSIVYTGPGVRVYENQGDGTFAMLPTSTVASFLTGLDLGMSAEDWDNDGDIDFSTRQVFRRNQLMETGTLSFTVATHSIPSSHITSATPAWCDWDRDGDLDCALGNWLSTGRFYENTLYDGTEPLSERRFVRVRCLDDTLDPAGLETAYGTIVEVVVRGDTSGYRRKKFVASSAGYLNQNEYTLHFALPPDPSPGHDTHDLDLDIIVDFPSLPATGYYRVDRHVNPALGWIDLADLAEREVVVYRSGRVSIDGVEFDPPMNEAALLTAAAGGLVTAPTSVALPAPTDTMGIQTRSGIAFDTFGATQRVRIREL
ncbi:MAG: VCBS repeat-containing protein, partial [Planctomycetes bacterium]|nr:VCBS repeat-containing protein [Planctomycetota bacterium]